MGGQAALTHIIENYPGFPEGLEGAKLGELFREQAERFGAEVVYDNSDRSRTCLSSHTKYVPMAPSIRPDTVVIATGANPRHLEIPR